MHEIKSNYVRCPYCGENFEALIDCSQAQQFYIEDCEVCCRPINFNVTVNQGVVNIILSNENE